MSGLERAFSIAKVLFKTEITKKHLVASTHVVVPKQNTIFSEFFYEFSNLFYFVNNKYYVTHEKKRYPIVKKKKFNATKLFTFCLELKFHTP